jgi:hypothetical protein
MFQNVNDQVSHSQSKKQNNSSLDF